VTIAIGHEFDRMFVEAFEALGWTAESVLFYDRGTQPGWWNYLSRSRALLAGAHATFEREKQRCVARLHRIVRERQPNVILCIRGEWIDKEVIESLRALRPGLRIATWMYDPVRMYAEGLDGTLAADRFYLYDQDDVDYYVSTTGAPATRLELGYSAARFHPLPRCEQTVDVSMIGSFGLNSYDRRLRVADRLVLLSRKHGFSLRLIGPMWKNWAPMAAATRRQAAQRWPNFLAKFENRPVSYPEQNRLYNASRININVHRDESDGSCNTRVFEICGAGGFQLCDYNPIVAQALEDGREIQLFADEKMMEEKLMYYLANPERRATIAVAGLNAVIARHQFVHRVARILDDVFPDSTGRPGGATQPAVTSVM
jgi:hypothetical protein